MNNVQKNQRNLPKYRKNASFYAQTLTFRVLRHAKRDTPPPIPHPPQTKHHHAELIIAQTPVTGILCCSAGSAGSKNIVQITQNTAQASLNLVRMAQKRSRAAQKVVRVRFLSLRTSFLTHLARFLSLLAQKIIYEFSENHMQILKNSYINFRDFIYELLNFNDILSKIHDILSAEHANKFRPHDISRNIIEETKKDGKHNLFAIAHK